jgi:acetolactate synthase-1/2/3 large subunit
MTVAADRYLAEALAAKGVTHFFHVPVIVPSAMREMTAIGATLPVMAHSEKAAAYMADGYARTSGRPGLCGSQTIGGTNLASGLRDAYLARIPVLALSGGKQLHSQYRGQYQEIDDMPVYESLTKFNATVWAPDRLPDLLESAFRAATTGSPAPVHLELSGVMGDIATSGSIESPPELSANFSSFPALRPPADADDVRRAASLLAEARKLVIVAGGGARISGAGEQIRQLSQRLQAPVATAMNAKALIPENEPLALGVVGEYSTDAANRAVSEADLVFYVGSSVGGLTTRNWTVPAAGSSTIQLDIDPENLGRNYPAAVALCGDARAVLEQLLDALPGAANAGSDAWLETVAELKGEWEQRVAPQESSRSVPLMPQTASRELAEALPADAILVCDTGHIGAWLAQNMRINSPGQTVLRAHGSLGWSFPASIGAKCAAPERPVVCFTGDGGFLYHLAELETALRYGIRVVAVVNDNAALSQERELWDGPTEHLWRMRPTDFAATAEAFGCVGFRVEQPGDLAATLERALASDRPAVVSVATDDTATALPAWSPAGSVGMYDSVRAED